MPAIDTEKSNRAQARPYRPKKRGRTVPFEPRGQKPVAPKPGYKGPTVTYARGFKSTRGGVSEKYRNSSFNPFANHPGGISAGSRIKRGADNRPNEGDSDYVPRSKRNRKRR